MQFHNQTHNEEDSESSGAVGNRDHSLGGSNHMHKAIAATILGATAAVLSTMAFVPQIRKTWKTGGEDLSYFMLSLYVAGVTLWLCYGLVLGATALSLANAASIVFAGT